MTDLLIYETGSGGDLVLRGNDLALVYGYENAPYLAMFGGNKFWGNYLIPAANQFKSQTEDALRNNPLTSAGRKKIEDAVKADLAFLTNVSGTTYTVTATIVNSNRLDINIVIDGKVISMMWEPDKLFLTYKIG